MRFAKGSVEQDHRKSECEGLDLVLSGVSLTILPSYFLRLHSRNCWTLPRTITTGLGGLSTRSCRCRSMCGRNQRRCGHGCSSSQPQRAESSFNAPRNCLQRSMAMSLEPSSTPVGLNLSDGRGSDEYGSDTAMARMVAEPMRTLATSHLGK